MHRSFSSLLTVIEPGWIGRASPGRSDPPTYLRREGEVGLAPRGQSIAILDLSAGARGSVFSSHAASAVSVDPEPAGIGTYLVSAVLLLLALGIAIFLYILIGEGVQIEDKSKTDKRLSLKLALRRD